MWWEECPRLPRHVQISSPWLSLREVVCCLPSVFFSYSTPTTPAFEPPCVLIMEKRKDLSEETIGQITALKKVGKQTKDIVAQIGVCVHSVHTWVAKACLTSATSLPTLKKRPNKAKTSVHVPWRLLSSIICRPVIMALLPFRHHRQLEQEQLTLSHIGGGGRPPLFATDPNSIDAAIRKQVCASWLWFRYF